MALQTSNNVFLIVSSPVAVSDTTITLVDATGLPDVSDPADWTIVTLIRLSDLQYEILRVDSIAGNVLTVQRAQEGTTALTYSGGDQCRNFFTSGMFEQFTFEANAAQTSEANAATSAAAAATSATNASTSETNAATSASNASTSETNAATSETNASTSETNAANSASSASTSETNASTSETNAAASATAAANSATAAANSAALGSVFSAGYNFDTTLTDADPGSGNLRFNNATPASITELYMDYEDSSATSKQNLLSVLQDGNTVIIERKDDPQSFIIVLTMDTITDETGYYKAVCTYVDHAGTLPTNGQELSVRFVPAAGGSGGGGFPSSDIDKTGNYTIVSGDVGNNLVLTSGASADATFTLDVSLLALGDQITFINESDYRLKIVVSNTSTMTLNSAYTDLFIWKGESATLGGDTSTNARILARP